MLEGLTWYKQSAFRWQTRHGPTVYVDPWGVPDGAPPADVIFITHAHYDHLSLEDIHRIRAEGTKLFAPSDVATELSGDVTPVAPGDAFDVSGIGVQAVPAYNRLEERLDYHPKANGWVGYVFTTPETSYYHAGDTDHLEELNAVRADVALVPIGGTFTMSPPEAAGLVKLIRPKVAVPMHYGFVVGDRRDAEVFVQEAAPVRVETLEPQRPWGEGASD